MTFLFYFNFIIEKNKQKFKFVFVPQKHIWLSRHRNKWICFSSAIIPFCGDVRERSLKLSVKIAARTLKIQSKISSKPISWLQVWVSLLYSPLWPPSAPTPTSSHHSSQTWGATTVTMSGHRQMGVELRANWIRQASTKFHYSSLEGRPCHLRGLWKRWSGSPCTAIRPS